jgi:hypothetical protein
MCTTKKTIYLRAFAPQNISRKHKNNKTNVDTKEHDENMKQTMEKISSPK